VSGPREDSVLPVEGASTLGRHNHGPDKLAASREEELHQFKAEAGVCGIKLPAGLSTEIT